MLGASTAGKSSLRIPVGSAPFINVAGDLFHGATGLLHWNHNTKVTSITGVLHKQTATVSRIGTTSTPQELFSPVVSLPANYYTAGHIIKVKAWGFHSVSTPGTHSIDVQLAISGAARVGILDFATIQMDTSTTNGKWSVDSSFTVRSAGGSGTVVSDGILTYTIGSSPTIYTIPASSTGLVTIDTTEATSLEFLVTIGGGDIGDRWECQQAMVEIV